MILLCIGALLTHSRAPATAHPTITNVTTPTFGEPVLRVVDGDTIVVLHEGNPTKVRLIGVNTPEVVDPRKPVQCFGEEASENAKKILTGKNVRLELDPTQSTYDKYGRLLAYVFLEDGTNFDEEQVRDGFGYEYTYGTPYTYQKEFKAAEVDAQKNQRGLWASGVCIGKPTAQ